MKKGMRNTLTGYDFRYDKPLTRTQAIKMKCLECMCWSAKAIRECTIYDCALYPYRTRRRKSKGEQKNT
mgnify:CR=1 FL=1